LSIQPSDSAKLAAGSLKTMTPTLRNAVTGMSVPNPVIRYSVRQEDMKRVALHHPEIRVGGILVQISNTPQPAASQIGALDPEGSAWIYGSVDAYGTAMRDSVMITFSYPFASTIFASKSGATITSPAQGQTITLAPGAKVTFQCLTFDPLLKVSYEFDNPAAAMAASPPSTTGGASGNVTALSNFEASSRRFVAPGIYRWTAVASGPLPWNGRTLGGTIVIK
jgi:hypothetical protein